MRAVIWQGPRKMEVGVSAVPQPGMKELLVKIHSVGICGSELSGYLGESSLRVPPLIMGHEFSGEIVEIGSEVTGFEIGQKATGINVLGENYNDMRRIGILSNGAFAEYVIVHEDFLFAFPDSTSAQIISMVESYAVAMRGIHWAKIDPEKPIIIIGAGTIGLAMLDLLRALYPKIKILMVEIHPFLREKAIEFGATNAVSPQKGKIRKFSKQFGVAPLIFDCAGTQETLKFSTEIIAQGGDIIMVGIPRGQIMLSGLIVSLKEVGLRGCISHTRKDIDHAIELILENKVHPERLVTHYVPLTQLSHSIEKYKSTEPRDFIKIMVKITD